MKFFEQLTSANKKYPWDILGFLLGVLGLLLVLFPPSFENKPGLTYLITENSKIIDINESLNDLKISYRDKNIIEDSLNIWILSLKIKNTGETDITKNMFDSNYPIGVRIENGSFIDPPKIIETSNEYLNQTIKINFVDSISLITFPEFIFDKEDFFTVKFRILFKNGNQPKFKPIGKLAGIKKIEIEDAYFSKRKTLPTWLFILLGILIFGMQYFFYAFEERQKKNRKKLVFEFNSQNNDEVEGKEMMLDYFVQHGLHFLQSLSFYINNPKYIKNFTGYNTDWSLKLKSINLKGHSGYTISHNEFFKHFKNYENLEEKIVSSNFKLLLQGFTKFIENKIFFEYESI